MLGQLQYLLELTEWPNIEVQILPYTATTNPAVDGSFTILHVEAGNFPIVIVDGFRRTVFIEEDEDVAAYGDVRAGLCRIALSEAETCQRIEQAIRDIQLPLAERTS
ncbi:hypothetical protein HGB48_14245 [Actinomadura latina]|uniref:DUF5753 domain-containing protein n=1 Tax=Actinomadura latina TaxID=163603 RepID=A0A846YWP6_9ACTN|nr:Scr1 family TA system antitoxin-like transcriptional regulator [Actinomadura latina]NKZ04899.1 hypothetical protein [Actinomadura latina]